MADACNTAQTMALSDAMKAQVVIVNTARCMAANSSLAKGKKPELHHRPFRHYMLKELRMSQKMWDIWIEGYITTGMEGNAAKATYEGVWQGETFKDACEVWAESKGGDKRFFDPRDLSFWGCRLFDNEEDARKSFG